MKLLEILNEIEVPNIMSYRIKVDGKTIIVAPEDVVIEPTSTIGHKRDRSYDLGYALYFPPEIGNQREIGMDWFKAKEACEKLGPKWRLPTIEELKAMHKQLYVKGKGNFKSGFYWSSSQRSYGPVLTMSFDKDFTYDFYKENDFLQVRPVRDI